MILSSLGQAILAFNLVCTGSSVTLHERKPKSGDFRLEKKRDLRPMSFVYRVDLDANRYCADACAETQPIASVTYGNIVFEDETDGWSGQPTYRKVSRESGEYYGRRERVAPGGAEHVIMIGACKRAPFTGFPKQEF